MNKKNFEKDLEKRYEELDAVIEAFRSSGYDTVQIFLSFYDEETGETHNIQQGSGLLGQRVWQVQNWIDDIYENSSIIKRDSSEENESE